MTIGGRRSVEVVLAEWVLQRFPPERVPLLAVEALQAGCQSATIAVLAGLQKPTRADVEDHLSALVQEIGHRRPSRDEALKTLVDATAHEIVAGQVDPLAGASRIWAL